MTAFRGFARMGLGFWGGGLLVLTCLSMSGMTARADEPQCPNCARSSVQSGETLAGTGVTTCVRGAEPVGKGGWLGARLGELPEELRLHLRLPKDQAFLIENVVKDSPADGRLQRYDIVLAVDGKPASRDLSKFMEIMRAKQPGDTLNLSVLHGGERSTLAIKLAARAANPEAMKLVYEDEKKEETAVTCQLVPGSKVGTFHVDFAPRSGPQNDCAITRDNKTYRFQMEDKKLVVTVSDLQGKELTKLFTTREDLEKADRQLYRLYQEASANRPKANVGYMTLKIAGDEGQDAKQSGRIVVHSITGNLVDGAQLQALLPPPNVPCRPGQQAGGVLVQPGQPPMALSITGRMQVQPNPCAGCPMAQPGRPMPPGSGSRVSGEAGKACEMQEAAEVLERVRFEAQARMGTPEQMECRVEEARGHARAERARQQPGRAFPGEFMPGFGGAVAGRPMTVARPLPPGFSPWVASVATPSFSVALNGEITAEVTTPVGSIRKTFANEGDLQNRAPGLYRKYQQLAEELK